MAGSARYPFKNVSQQPIIVVMDHARETHLIAPGAQVIFENANVGDNPTFHVHTVNPDGSEGHEIYADSFSTIRVFHAPGGRDLVWTGSKIEDQASGMRPEPNECRSRRSAARHADPVAVE